MGERCIANECLSSTGFSYTLSLINGKYKMTILYTLMEFGVVRFNEMNWEGIISTCSAVNPWIKDIPTFVAFSVIPYNLAARSIT